MIRKQDAEHHWRPDFSSAFSKPVTGIVLGFSPTILAAIQKEELGEHFHVAPEDGAVDPLPNRMFPFNYLAKSLVAWGM